jgi:hypothetical protein
VVALAAVAFRPADDSAAPSSASPLETPVADSPAVDVSKADRTVDWAAVAQQLSVARADALARLDADALGSVYVSGSRAAAADLASIERWLRQQRRPVGLRARVLDVRVLRATASSAALLLTERLSAYRVVDGSGRVVGRGRSEVQTVRLSVVRRAGTWLVRAVRPGRPQSTRAVNAASTSS